MTTEDLFLFILDGEKLTAEQKMSEIKLANNIIILGFNSVIVRRNNKFKTIHAFNLEIFENIYTLDKRLISNRIS